MKKSLLVLLLCGTVIVCHAQTQLNYFKEAQYITKFVKANAALAPGVAPFHFTVNAVSHMPELNAAADQAAFTALVTAYAAQVHKTVPEIQTEFTFLVFLMYDNDQTHLKQVVSVFPAQFQLIISVAAGSGNADLGSTGFDIATLQSNAINALAKLALDRAKKELTEVYLNQWYDRLSTDEVVQPLIPKTLSVFKAFNADNTVNLASYGDKWKTAFHEDLQNIPLRFQDQIYVNKVLTKAGIPAINEIGPVIVGGDSIIYQLSQKNHLVNILDQMATNDISDTNPAIFKKLVVLTSMMLSISGQMDVDGETYNPVMISTLKTMSLDDWHLMLKLLYIRKNQALNYGIGETAVDNFVRAYIVNPNVNSFIALTNQTVTIATNYQKLIVKPAVNTDTNILDFDQSRQMLDLCFQLIDNVQGYRQLFNPAATVKTDYQAKIKPFFDHLSQLGHGIQTKQYGEVMDAAIGIIAQVDQCNGVSPAATTGPLNTTVKNLQIYGSFMLNVLTAKSDTAISAALDELVPQGDYKLKNAPAFTASLSMFPGASLGAEWVQLYPKDASGNPDMSKPQVTNRAFAPSIYLPIGVDLNWGHKASGSTPDVPKYNSWGMLFQVLDLGAVLSYRAGGDDAVSTAPTITVRQVLSPGFCVTHHLTNSPVVFGLGISDSPSLRQISQGAATYGANSLRVGAFVAVDVTFFSIGGKNQPGN